METRKITITERLFRLAPWLLVLGLIAALLTTFIN